MTYTKQPLKIQKTEMEKQEQIPGINQETRKQGVLKGFEENQELFYFCDEIIFHN